MGYHMNPLTCGVAKFNVQLAKRLGVPYVPLGTPVSLPLLSIKASEIPDKTRLFAGDVLEEFDLFLHGPCPEYLIEAARYIYCGNRALLIMARTIRLDAIAAWCPSTITGDPTRGAYRVLIFGMAHKLHPAHMVALKAQLDAEHPDYTVALSTAVHEGTPWDTGLADSLALMRAIFGSRLRELGYLGDDALARELQECDAVAAYFDPAVRENNTSIWAAVDAGKRIYTNTDALSPVLQPGIYTWDALVEIVRTPEVAHA